MRGIEGFIRILVIVFLGVVSFDCFNAHGQGCYEVGNKMICYFQPNETYIGMTWDDAWKVCKENNSTLPVFENRMIAETLRRHLEKPKDSLPSEMWLAGREIRTNVWQWLNGKPFGQQNLFGDPDTLKNSFYTNAVVTGNLKYDRWIYVRDPQYYICHYNDSVLCQNKSTIPWKNGCLFVNNDEQLNLVDARNKCLDEAGDLATFEDDEDLEILRKNSSLLYRNRNYWIGLRLNWWSWNETDSSKEIKYSNWTTYLNRQNQECLFIHFFDYKWNQDRCNAKKPFICQTVITTSKRPGADDLDASTPTLFSQRNDTSPRASTIDFQTAIIIGAIAVVVVVIVTIVLVIILKRTKNKRICHTPNEKPTTSNEMSTQPIEHKSVKSKAVEPDEMSNHYAEIPRVDDHENNYECGDEPQGIVYAALEFDANKAIYEEPDLSNQHKQEGGAPAKAGARRGNDQPGSFAESSTQAAEGTIYANM